MADKNKSMFQLPGDLNDLSAMDRRQILRLGLASGTMMLFGLNKNLALAADATQDSKFMIYIHAGSWDGVAAGMIQPNSPGSWQRGLFVSGTDDVSLNPNLNNHYQVNPTGNLILNPYSMPLETISEHVFMAVGNARSSVHNSGFYFQATGADEAQPNCAWTVGAAQAFNGDNTSSAVINIGGNSRLGKVSGVTDQVVQANAGSISSFRSSFQDQINIKKGAEHSAIWNVLKDLNNKNLNAPDLSGTPATSLNGHIESHVGSLPDGLKPDSALIASVEAAINRVAVDNMIDTKITAANDAAGVKSVKGRFDLDDQYESLLNRLKLAAVLAKTGIAKGMSISLEGQDYHDPNTEGGKNSQVYTARAAGQMYAQIATFWKWVVANGLKDNIMIVISHDFTRTPYVKTGAQTTLDNAQTVLCDGVPKTIQGYQTDHYGVMGMVFINGNVPPASRYGGITDGFGVRGSTALNGQPSDGVKAATSIDLIGSMLMRCFPKHFPRDRDVKKYWPNFTQPIALLLK